MFCLPRFQYRIQKVATVLTACGIETHPLHIFLPYGYLKLQQYLLFTVLKQASEIEDVDILIDVLQQYLPFTVLKLIRWNRAVMVDRCNSTYRLRY